MTARTTSCIPGTTESSSSSMKRRSSSPLDCQSLQSSLKRVRLSRSPGELRLQRDLCSLPGWEMVSPECWRRGNAHLTLEDSLRVILHFESSKIWIQIPRMYPHRPPTIARMEGVTWMRDVVVQDAPSGDEYPPRVLDCGTTVIYEWSPIMYLGDLLDFLLESKGRAASNMTLSKSSSSMCSGSTACMGSNTRMGALNNDLNATFLEEHKMEDGVAPHHHLNLYFPPNRFDVGYGKYMDLLAAAGPSPQQPCSNNAMDVN